MKVVVVGGTGLIGSRLVTALRECNLNVVVASPSSGINTITGEGLADALYDAQVVVDVSNSPSLQDDAALRFFLTSGRNLLTAEEAALRIGRGAAVIVASGASAVAAAARRRGGEVEACLPDLQPHARTLAEIAHGLMPLTRVRPLYLRAPDAKEQRGARLGATQP